MHNNMSIKSDVSWYGFLPVWTEEMPCKEDNEDAAIEKPI